MTILNGPDEDLHIHSMNYSDGLCTIEEIVRLAGEIGLSRIAITDHSQAMLDHYGMARKCVRAGLERWKNVWNEVEVVFGVECDLLDEKGRICDEIDGKSSDFLILSYHKDMYEGDRSRVAEGFVAALRSRRFEFVGHVCVDLDPGSSLAVIGEANRLGVPLELNATYYLKSPGSWDILFDNAERIYLNSDSHNLYELKHQRRMARELMASEGRSPGMSR